MVCNVYFVEWEFCRIIPLGADCGISVGALCAGALHCHVDKSKLLCMTTVMNKKKLTLM